jgi:hypothetical protein
MQIAVLPYGEFGAEAVPISGDIQFSRPESRNLVHRFGKFVAEAGDLNLHHVT